MTGLSERQGRLPNGGSYLVHDQGAQLTAWATGPDPVLFVSAASWFEPGRSVRGGVPICFPWFGPGRGEAKSPTHGFARLALWRLVESRETDHGARFEYLLTEEDVRGLPGAEHFAAPFQARCTIEVGPTATVSLNVRNTGPAPLEYEAALHSYLYVGDVARIRLRGLEGATWFDKLDGNTYRQEGDLVLTGETDRVYSSTATVEIDDPVLDRVLVIDKSGSANTVVWTPGPEKAAEVEDFAPGDWERLVCVEAGNVLDHAIRLDPGAEHSLSTTLATRSR